MYGAHIAMTLRVHGGSDGGEVVASRYHARGHATKTVLEEVVKYQIATDISTSNLPAGMSYTSPLSNAILPSMPCTQLRPATPSTTQ